MLLIGDFGKIEINILSRNNSDDYWDGNWLYSNITINIGFFSANYNCNLRTDEFSLFNEKLEELLAEKITESQFSSMEDGLLLNFKKDLLGNFILNGEGKNDDNYNVSLLFKVSVDYNQMEQLRNSIYNLLQKYPRCWVSNLRMLVLPMSVIVLLEFPQCSVFFTKKQKRGLM
jgi:hypothetical protein